MRVVVALGGNALLKRGEPMTAQVQRINIRTAVRALADLAGEHSLVITHGNGPQVGLLALQSAAVDGMAPYPLDVISAESMGMIGYMVELELLNALPDGTRLATILTEIEVDRTDPAFDRPEKPIGPVYERNEARQVADIHSWAIREESPGKWRRVVPSPLPRRILQMDTIRLLVQNGVTVICVGGGGIPVIRTEDGRFEGVEGVIDKDRAAELLARQLEADALLMLTDVDGVYEAWGTDRQRRMDNIIPGEIRSADFPAGSMGPKVEAALSFASQKGRIAGIGRLEDARAILERKAGTIFSL